VRLDQVVRAEGTRFRYRYDFGDEWRHEVVVERIAAPDPAEPAAIRCIGGRRASPPEDCGGPPGYAMLLAAFQQPEHPAFRDWIEAHGGFDPSLFDREAIHRALDALD
jgi:hypothetical protein